MDERACSMRKKSADGGRTDKDDTVFLEQP
jgi:hypothetical protein